MADQRLLTTVVGSFPQPDWLIDRQALLSGGVARVRNQGLWRIPKISRSRFPMVRFLALIIGWLLEFFHPPRSVAPAMEVLRTCPEDK